MRSGYLTGSPCCWSSNDVEGDVQSGNLEMSQGSQMMGREGEDCLMSSPDEIKLRILGLLGAREIVRISVVCREWHRLCFDGSLWMCFDAAPFYHDIPARQLVRIISGSGRFIRHLNLRGCTQLDHDSVMTIAQSCTSLESIVLEGCRAFDHTALITLIANNRYLTSLDLTCLPSVTNTICRRIAANCAHLTALDLSWCYNMDSRGLKRILDRCRGLQELRLCESQELDCNDIMRSLSKAEKLEVLHLAGCHNLTDDAFRLYLDELGMKCDGEASRLRHLNLSRCPNLTTITLTNLADRLENLEYLELAALNVTDIGFSLLMPTLHHLTHLDCEDCSALTDLTLFSIAKAPCASTLTHLQFSSCENLSDDGVVAIIRACSYLQSLDLDNTTVGDAVLIEAAGIASQRHVRAAAQRKLSLKLTIYDCQNITWLGVRQVLEMNAKAEADLSAILQLKCFYGWQRVVDAHTRRLVRGEAEKAAKILQDWVEWMCESRSRRRTQMFNGDASDVEEEEEEEISSRRRRVGARLADCLLM